MSHSLAVNISDRSPARLFETRGTTLRVLIAGVLTSVGYFFGARLGFALTFRDHPVSTLWPPNSILLAALLLTPYRWWWLMLLMVFPAHLLIELNSGVPTGMVLCWFVSNICEALIGALIIRRFSDAPTRVDSIRRVAVFFTAALTAPFVSSFLDAGFVVLNGFGNQPYWAVWRLRFLSNVLSELTIVPVILIWSRDVISRPHHISFSRALEIAALIAALLIVGFGVFSGRWTETAPSPALLYAPLPILLWAAVRFGPKGVNTSLAVVAFLAIASAVHGRGPFIAPTAEENALSIQLFMTVIAVPLMFLAAVLVELNRSQREVSENADQLRLALGAAQMGLWDWHIAKNLTTWSDETKRMFGFKPADPELEVSEFYALIHPNDRDRVQQAIELSIAEQVPYEAEFRFHQRDGSYRWIRGKGRVLTDRAGNAVRMVGINVDITTRKEAEAKMTETDQQLRALAGRLIRAQEDERRRISYQLHDDLSQKLATLSVGIGRLRRKRPPEPERIAQLNNLYDLTEDLSNQIRQLSHELHPATLEHLGLADALAVYINEFQSTEGIPTNFSCRLSSEEIPFELSVCLYRVTLEGLRNIAKHADAKAVIVRLSEDSEFVKLEVIDSGVGFDVETLKRGSGLGLLSAQERVKLLQGTLEVASHPGDGTKLTVRLPLK